MAKQYGKNAAVDFAATNLMSFGKSFSRLSGQPLDKSEIWYDDKQALIDYAKTDAAFVGQKVVFIDTTNNKVTHYGIELDGSLKELGSSPVGDEKTIVVDEATGTVSLAGISGLAFTEENEAGEEVQVNYQPLLTDAGLVWVRPSATTVEGLAAEIETLKQNVYTKTQTDEAIAKAVADAGHTKRSVVETLPEASTAEENIIYMMKNANVEEGDAYQEYMLIDGTLVQIGDTSVDLTNYAAWKTKGEGEDMSAYPVVVRDNDGHVMITEMTVKDFTDHKADTVAHVTADERTAWNAAKTYVDNMPGLLEGYVAKEEGKGLSTNDFTDQEKTKLANLKETIGTGDVDGLSDLLNGYVTKEEGKGLSSNDFTDELLDKLNGINAEAQVNVLEMVQVAGVNQTITDKTINILVATESAAGVVKSSAAENGVTVAADGTMSVNSLSVDKLVQSEDQVLVLDGGGAGAAANA